LTQLLFHLLGEEFAVKSETRHGYPSPYSRTDDPTASRCCRRA
jgi:hypothetical protein